jgi:hypothetical protein
MSSDGDPGGDFGLSPVRHACAVCGWDPALSASMQGVPPPIAWIGPQPSVWGMSMSIRPIWPAATLSLERSCTPASMVACSTPMAA